MQGAGLFIHKVGPYIFNAGTAIATVDGVTEHNLADNIASRLTQAFGLVNQVMDHANIVHRTAPPNGVAPSDDTPVVEGNFKDFKSLFNCKDGTHIILLFAKNLKTGFITVQTGKGFALACIYVVIKIVVYIIAIVIAHSLLNEQFRGSSPLQGYFGFP
jgi:hypothetical protein